jgi:hypothetical protein
MQHEAEKNKEQSTGDDSWARVDSSRNRLKKFRQEQSYKLGFGKLAFNTYDVMDPQIHSINVPFLERSMTLRRTT